MRGLVTNTHAASSDGWLMAQIAKTAPDIATVQVAFDELRERHAPFFLTDFMSAFHSSLNGRTE